MTWFQYKYTLLTLKNTNVYIFFFLIQERNMYKYRGLLKKKKANASTYFFLWKVIHCTISMYIYMKSKKIFFHQIRYVLFALIPMINDLQAFKLRFMLDINNTWRVKGLKHDWTMYKLLVILYIFILICNVIE